MKLISIEPTPSPNSMKLNLDVTLPTAERHTYNKKDTMPQPETIRLLLAIPGVTGLYHAADFMAIDRHPKSDWQSILSEVRSILGKQVDSDLTATSISASRTANMDAGAWGEVRVAVQFFRGIPMQVRVYAGEQQQRSGLPERFTAAAIRAGLASPNLIMERKLEEFGIRYGELTDVLEQISNELSASYNDNRLNELVAQAERLESGEAPKAIVSTLEAAEQVWSDPDWRIRYSALEKIKPNASTLPLLAKAIQDSQVSIRRLAAVYLGDLRTPAAMKLLFMALNDSSPIVRRTVGDTLSDIGDPVATLPMTEALKDRNKLVRWRAARFLYEVGLDSALPALREARDDPEFEVRMQIQIAIERMEGGEDAAGSVWQQMTNRERT
ncbi:MAG: conserved virulence factor C family protein [Gorillibacterium sp.]|nr:conserved virulence factor C family protein [Gorillibacterium sp.]